MFKNFSEFVSGAQKLELDLEGSPNEQDLQVATLTFLIELARCSDRLTGEEIHRICTAMFLEFGIEERDTGHLMEVAELLRKQPGRLESCVKTINTHFDATQKQRVMALVWKVVSADGLAQKEETKFASDLRKSLNLTLEQAVRAQQISQEAEDIQVIINSDDE